jgi:predicted ATP-dependent protease
MEAHGFTLVEQENSVLQAPISMKHPGEVMTEEELEELQEQEPDVFAQLMGPMKDEADKLLEELNKSIQALSREVAKSSREKDEALIRKALTQKLGPLTAMAAGQPLLEAYLAGILDLLTKASLKEESSGGGHPMVQMLGAQAANGAADTLALACTVNLLVDNHGQTNPPVIHAEVPNYSDLFGRINPQMTRDGGVAIDHTMVDSGSVLQANGGFLVLDLDDLLQYGGGLAFFKLMATLRSGKLRIETKGGFLDIGGIDFHTKDLPIQVRVIAICSPMLGWILRRHVDDVDDLFRVNSEFDTEMPLSAAPGTYAAFVELCRASEPELPEFSPEAIARLVEHGVRRAGDQHKATTEFGWLKDLITEAAHWCVKGGSETVMSWHIDHTVSQKFERSAKRIRRYQEYLDRGTIIWNDDGELVGQINALVVLQLTREVIFGAPSRITCRAFAGKGEVALVQRDVKTSGPSSNTAVAVIQGWLSGQYGRKKALGLGVQLNFEQCYGGVDGDSASLAETVAIVSALTGLPINQRLSITGSMDQWGQAQPIGGVNYKLEGHFEALQRRGKLAVNSGHGAIIPVQNRDDLMLNRELVEACAKGEYTVYAVSHIDEALELLLGLPAAEVHRQVTVALAGLKPVPWYRRLWTKLFGRKPKPVAPLPALPPPRD